MNIENATIGTVFFTTYAYMDHKQPRFGVIRWSLISVEHRVAMMIDRSGTPFPNHTRVIEKDESVHLSESDAWGACAVRFQELRDIIYKGIEECRKNQAESFEETLSEKLSESRVVCKNTLVLQN